MVGAESVIHTEPFLAGPFTLGTLTCHKIQNKGASYYIRFHCPPFKCVQCVMTV